MKILIADDHALVRSGMKHILSEEYPTAHYGEADCGNRVLDQVTAEDWDVLILDIGLPDKNGLEVLTDVRNLAPDLPVLVVSMYPEEQFGLRVLRAGGRGYLNKETAPAEIVSAVAALVAGRRYITPSLADRMAEDFDEVRATDTTPLSNRERAVLQLLFDGHPLKEIAARMELSPKTVSTYRQRILSKWGLSSNAELVQYVIKHSLLDP